MKDTLDLASLPMDITVPEQLVTQANIDQPITDIQTRTGQKPRIETELKTGLDSVVKWTWRITGICALTGLIVALIIASKSTPSIRPEAGKMSILLFMTAILSFTFAAIGIITGLICIPFGRKYRREVDRIQSGHYLAHWIYDDQQWKKFVADEECEAREISSMAIWATSIIGGILCIPLWMGFSATVALPELVLLVGLVLTFSVSLGYIIGKLVTCFQLKKLARWQTNPWFAIIGNDGLYFANGYYPYSTLGSALVDLRAESKGSMNYLVFTYRYQNRDGYVDRDYRIPVPTEKQSEADSIMALIA